MILHLLVAAALAIPPSTSLSGPEGKLTWDVRQEGDVIHFRFNV